MESAHEIGFGKYVLYQDQEGFKYGIDAVLLSDYASKAAEANSVIADFGTGNGIVPIILCHKREDVKLTGFEVQNESAVLAEKNVVVNDLSNRIEIVNDDILNIESKYFDAFDMVVSNPPYVKQNSGIKNSNIKKMIARHETSAGLNDFVYMAGKCLKESGKMLLVYRPARLKDLFMAAENNGFGVSDITMVHPFAEKNANIMLACLIKGRKCELNVSSSIVVRNTDGTYTETIKKIYEKM